METKAERVWADGCYDMVHFGHANQLRQAKALGKYLVVGVHNDYDVTRNKGPPVFTEEERYRMVRAIKWVDEVVPDAPYIPAPDTLDKHGCDFVVHGDDISLTAEGTDAYIELKKAGRYRECKRTAGISTTDLVGRMLLLTKTHHSSSSDVGEHEEKTHGLASDTCTHSPWTRVAHFLPSSRTLQQFTEGRAPREGDRIVYVSGAFDLFHVGHLAFLEEAAKLGDYVIVGIPTDQEVNSYEGGNLPIMTLHERVLSVLAYRPVSEIIIGAPYGVTDEIIDQFNVDVVVNGSRIPHHIARDGRDPYEAAKRRGIFTTVDSGSDMTTSKIISRIIDNHLAYKSRNDKKERKEDAAVEELKKGRGEDGKLNTMAVCNIALDCHGAQVRNIAA